MPARRAVFNLDRQLRFTSANAAALELFGAPIEAMLGRPFADTAPGMAGGDGYAALQRAVATLQPVRVTVLSVLLGRPVALEILPTAAGVTVTFEDAGVDQGLAPEFVGAKTAG